MSMSTTQQEPVSAAKKAGDELDAFRQWLEQGLLPEVQPSQQQRSIKTALALLKAGETLLMDRSFEALSVEDVCVAAGTTVGGFYGRFENKQAFFVSMQRYSCLRGETMLKAFVAKKTAENASLGEICRELVAMQVKSYRANLGVMRASLQHQESGMWDVFRALGDKQRAVLTRQISPHLVQLPQEQRALRIQFAHQVMIGMLVHATLNNPGPVHLQDESLIQELTTMLTAYLSSP